jgi:hypothetical protein
VDRQGDIEGKLKIALDETRMLIMGVQILIGFQFQAIVQESFAGLPWSSRAGLAAALLLMVGTAGLLIAPAAQHRLVEKGEATARIIGVTTFHMEIALVVLAIGIALDLYVAFERIHGFATSLALAAATFLVATICWYALALFFRAPNRKQEHAVSKTKSPTPYSKKIDYMLTEARVVLPGVQALLGFQLIAVLTKPFEQMPFGLKLVHAVGLGMMALSMILLLAPAALHRLGFQGEDVPTVHEIGSILVTLALAALALGLGAEVMAIGVLTGRIDIGVLVAGLALLMLLGFWYVWPFALRKRHSPLR